MEPIMWVMVIATGISGGLLAFWVIAVIAARTGRTATEWIKARRYVWNARKHNARARAKRLERTHYEYIPLPMGKSGYLEVGRQLLERLPNLDDIHTYERLLRQRAEDLWVDMEWSYDRVNQKMIVRWKPNPKKRPREIY